MDEFINYCTEEQTKRAIKLGAPIEKTGINHFPNILFHNNLYHVPTTQQMIGWLREYYHLYCGVDIDMNENECSDVNNCSYMFYKFNKCGVFGQTIQHSMHCYTYNEAELAAIDAALDYLEKKK